MVQQNANPTILDASHLRVTSRLTLRSMGRDDIDALLRLLAQRCVRRYLYDDRIPQRGEVEDVITRSLALNRASGAGLWAVTENARPTSLVGLVGLWPHRQIGLAPARDELVFALDEAHWGRGLATEAGTAMLEFASCMLGLRELHATTTSANAASIRTLRRLRFDETDAMRYPFSTVQVFRRSL